MKIKNEYAAYFTGLVICDVKHPKFGSHKLTAEQIKFSPCDYKNKLYRAIVKALNEGLIVI